MLSTDAIFTSTDHRRSILLGLGTALCITLVGMLTMAAGAGAQKRSFKPARVKHGVATFRLSGLVPREISKAYLTSAGKIHRLRLHRIRSGARRGILHLRVSRRHPRHSRANRSAHHRRDGAHKSRNQHRLVVYSSRNKHTKLVVESGPPSPPLSTTSCSTTSFSAVSLPGACWRPFADSSPFNQLLPASPRVATNSATIVSNLMAGGAPNAIRAGLADTSSDYYKPTYYAQTSDPIYTLRTGGYQHDGETLRAPQGLREAAGSDHHLTVIEPDGSHWGFWNAKVDNAAHTITGYSGNLTARKANLSGSGTGGNGTGCGATAAGFCNLAGIIRAQELEAGRIDHALFMTSAVSASSYVYPASNSDGSSSGSDRPAQGARFQLALSDAQIDGLGVPAWKKTVLTALAHYGAYLGDSSGAASFALGVESGSTYTSFGREDELVSFARKAGIASSNGVYTLDLNGVDWTRYLRVIEPCVTQSTC